MKKLYLEITEYIYNQKIAETRIRRKSFSTSFLPLIYQVTSVVYSIIFVVIPSYTEFASLNMSENIFFHLCWLTTAIGAIVFSLFFQTNKYLDRASTIKTNYLQIENLRTKISYDIQYNNKHNLKKYREEFIKLGNNAETYIPYDCYKGKVKKGLLREAHINKISLFALGIGFYGGAGRTALFLTLFSGPVLLIMARLICVFK